MRPMTITDLEWLSPPSPIHLPDSAVHIWRAIIPDEDIRVENLLSTLSLEEEDRARRFHKEQDTYRFIWHHATLRQVLCQYLNIEPQELMFDYSSFGKPSLSDNLNSYTLKFNMSHSGEILLIAITTNREIGVDVELVRSIPDMNRMVELYFTESEINWYTALTEPEKAPAFFSAWTRKEAFLKAIGEGLQYPPEQVEVSMDPEAVTPSLNLLGNSQDDVRYSLLSFQPTEGYLAALAVEGKDWSIRAFHFK